MRSHPRALIRLICFAIVVAVGVQLLKLPRVVTEAGGGTRRALLIGCGQYPHLPASLQLRGPLNDVMLMKQVLTERLEFAAENIVSLIDTATEQEVPSFNNIEREFRRLAATVQAGDQILIYLSGHGTQQPDQSENDDDLEPDGLDEVICTRDTTHITTQQATVIPGGITDDTIRKWCAEIVRSGAVLWVIIDTCHSGTITRGEEVLRRINPQELVPAAALSKVQKRAETISRVRGGGSATSTKQNDASLANFAALYAAQPDEPTVEMRLPKSASHRQPHGLLTYTLVQTIIQSRETMSFRELAQRITGQYAADGRVRPSPWVEGDAIDRVFLDGARHTLQSNHVDVTASGDKVHLHAGSLMGLTPGSVMSIHAAGQPASATPIGYVRITEVLPLESTGIRCKFRQQSSEFDLPRMAVARLVELAVEPSTMHLHITRAAADWFKDQVPHDIGGLTRVDEPQQSDWVIESVADQIELRSNASGQALLQLDQSRDPQWISRELRSRLQTAVRARRLLELASVVPTPVEKYFAQPECSVNLVKFANADDHSGKHLAVGKTPRLHHGDVVSLEISNSGSVPIDVTLLLVTADGDLQAIFPQLDRTGDARIPTGRTVRTPRALVEASFEGVEHAIALAVAAEGAPTTFLWLANPMTDGNRPQFRGGDLHSLNTSLGSDLNSWLLTNKVRGCTIDSGRSYSIAKVSWEVLPAQNLANP